MNEETNNSNKLDRIKTLIEKGNEYIEKQDYRLALSTFDMVLNEEPRLFDALIGKMKVYRELFQWENVIECANKIIEINPKEVTAIEHKIWALYALKEYKSALAFAEQARMEYPYNNSIQKCIDECKKILNSEEPKIKSDKFQPKLEKEKYKREVPEFRKYKEARETEADLSRIQEFEEIKKTNKFLIGVVYAFLVSFIIIYLIIDLTYFSNLDVNSSFLIQIALYASLLASFILLVKFDTHTNLKELGISRNNLLGSALIGFFVSLGFLITALLFWVGPINDLSTILTLALLTTLVGIVEELFFRGYIQSKARKSMSTMYAILLTGILFAILHIPKYFITPTTTDSSSYYTSVASAVQSLIVLGLLFGFIRENTKNILGPIVAHTTWDFYLLIYSPFRYSQLFSIANLDYFSLFQTIAGYAMLGTFLLAWGISSVYKIYILEDPRELLSNISEMSNSAKKYLKKARKTEFKIKLYSIKQDMLGNSNYYGYRSYELAKRKFKCKLDFYNTRKELYQRISEELTLENYSNLFTQKAEEEKKSKSDYSHSIRNEIKNPIMVKRRDLKIPKFNQFGYNISGLQSKIRELNRRKGSILINIEHYLMKKDLAEIDKSKNIRLINYFEKMLERLDHQIEYYDNLNDIYNDIAETVDNTNFREKRAYLNEQLRIQKAKLNEKLRRPIPKKSGSKYM